MAAPDLRGAVAQDFSENAVGTTKGEMPVRVFRSKKAGADTCIALTDGAKTAYVGMQDGDAYIMTDGVVRVTVSEEGVVTIPNLSATEGFNLAGIEDSLTAAPGGTQAGALALSATKSVHRVSTVGSANDSVALPPATGSGALHFVMNSAAANSM